MLNIDFRAAVDRSGVKPSSADWRGQLSERVSCNSCYVSNQPGYSRDLSAVSLDDEKA